MVPDQPERRKGFPAGFHRAAPRDPVTLALRLQTHLHRLSAGLVVVEIHEAAGIALDLASVEELAGEAHAKAHVHAAAAPFPAARAGALKGQLLALLVPRVAAARRDVPPAAGRRHRVRHPRRRDRVRERCFPATDDDDVAESALAADSCAIPSMTPELVLALLGAESDPIADGHHGVRRIPTHFSLPIRESWHSAADRPSTKRRAARG